MRTRHLIIHWIIVAIFGGSFAHAVELVGRPQTITAATSATVSWQTDVACGTRLQYGLNAAQLSQKAEGPVTSQHAVRLDGLVPGTTYHYSLGSARTQLGAGTFTTAGAAPSASPPPTVVRRILNAITPESKAVAATAPPARQTWANVSTLQDHFERHGADFSSKSTEDYAAQAWLFLQRARSENLPMKLDDTDGTLRIFDLKTGAFAAYNGTGRTKTYFKPGNPSYWQRQPGRQVKPADLSFPRSQP